MKQQINLYQPIFQRLPQHFSAGTVLILWSVFIAGLSSFYAYAWQQVYQLKINNIQLENERQHIVQRLQSTFSNKQTLPKEVQTLKNEISHLEQQIQAGQQLLNALKTQNFGMTQGFSSQLRALARYTPAQLWLTHIHFSQAGQNIHLQGNTFEPERIPHFVFALSQAPIFQPLLFKQVQINEATLPITPELPPEKKPKSSETAQVYTFILDTLPATHAPQIAH